jgi:pre-mRNA-splicing factor ATP-dependent RNA helicase DHX38/PRP16
MSSNDKETDFTHQLAIKLSRALNIVNPNDLLAQRVTDIAKTNSLDGFINGGQNSSTYLLSYLLMF